MPGSSERRRTRLLFATSNRGKLEEARSVLGPLGFSVEGCDAKGVEIQADTTAEVAANSAAAAASKLGEPVLVEDAGLFVDALGGFPGVYSAYALKTIGLRGVVALTKGSGSRAARFVSSVAYCEPGREPVVFEGSVRGRVAAKPRGSGGFGFDPIFVPDGSRSTFGEITLDEKCMVSHRGRALRKFAEWYLAEGRL
ncbi:MAG TPA: XTP/dITP diphosphatase [Nitrososphaerales archaeon]|nr:XTP/dITP diphosphatase [Nitrososphaerales archaeon]